MKSVKDYVLTIPDFPEKGIMFRDVTTVVGNPEGMRLAVDEMKARLEKIDFDVILAAESRGFLFGAPLSYLLNKPLALIRKKGKLPRATVSKEYALEYGTATIEIHSDAIKPGQKAVIVDDLIATGGTVKAACELVEELGGEVVECLFLLELKGLNGRETLKGYKVESVAEYEGK